MGRKGRKGRNQRLKSGNGGGSFVNMGGQTVTIPFRQTFNLVSDESGFNTNALDIHPSLLGDVVKNCALNFTWWRATRLKIRFCPGVRGGNSESFQFAAAFDSVPTNDLSSGPAGMGNMAQFPSFQMSGGEVINIVVPRKQLLSTGYKWFRCSATDSPPNDSFYQGAVWIGSFFGAAPAASLSHVCLVEGTIQLRSIIESSDLLKRQRAIMPLSENKEDSDAEMVDPPQPVPTSAFKGVVILDLPP